MYPAKLFNEKVPRGVGSNSYQKKGQDKIEGLDRRKDYRRIRIDS